jgi:hypothetical protein
MRAAAERAGKPRSSVRCVVRGVTALPDTPLRRYQPPPAAQVAGADPRRR